MDYLFPFVPIEIQIILVSLNSFLDFEQNEEECFGFITICVLVLIFCCLWTQYLPANLASIKTRRESFFVQLSSWVGHFMISPGVSLITGGVGETGLFTRNNGFLLYSILFLLSLFSEKNNRRRDIFTELLN